MQKEDSSLKYKGDSFFQSKKTKEPKDFLEGFWNTIIPAMPSAENTIKNSPSWGSGVFLYEFYSTT